MSLITWEEKYSVRIPRLDEHHKKLIGLINELHDAMKMGSSKAVLSKVIERMVDYTKFHFTAEESAMTKAGYSAYPGHKAEHDAFVNKALKYQEDFNSGKLMLSLDVMKFLREWLVNHIQVVDKKYGPVLKEKGVV